MRGSQIQKIVKAICQMTKKQSLHVTCKFMNMSTLCQNMSHGHKTVMLWTKGTKMAKMSDKGHFGPIYRTLFS